jgi:hypothetical protein
MHISDLQSKPVRGCSQLIVSEMSVTLDRGRRIPWRLSCRIQHQIAYFLFRLKCALCCNIFSKRSRQRRTIKAWPAMPVGVRYGIVQGGRSREDSIVEHLTSERDARHRHGQAPPATRLSAVFKNFNHL